MHYKALTQIKDLKCKLEEKEEGRRWIEKLILAFIKPAWFLESFESESIGYLLSTISVTGPSLIKDTSIIVWKRPVLTETTFCLVRLIKCSYSAFALSGPAAWINDGRPCFMSGKRICRLDKKVSQACILENNRKCKINNQEIRSNS